MRREGQHAQTSGPGRAHATAAVLFAAVFLAPLLQAAQSQRVSMEPGSRSFINISQPLGVESGVGWVPLDIEIRNGADRARRWTFRFSASTWSGTSELGSWDFEVPATGRHTFPILVPIHWNFRANRLASIIVSVDGPDVTASQIHLPTVRSGSDELSLLGMSPRLTSENMGRLKAALAPDPAAGGTQIEINEVSVSPKNLPADWRSFASFDTFWLHRDDWLETPAPHRTALLRWVAQGGRLYIAGLGPGLEGLPPTPQVDFFGDSAWQSGRHGLGLVTRLPCESEFVSGGAPGVPAAPIQTFRLPIPAVSGIVAKRSTSPALATIDLGINRTLVEAAFGERRVGSVALGLLVAAIAVILGPVNLWLFAPARRRSRIFVTVPVIAFAGAAALFILILVQDGTGGTGSRAVFLSLASDRPEALVLQEQTSASGFLVRRSFPLPDDVAMLDLSPMSPGDNRGPYYWMGNAGPRPGRSGLERATDVAGGTWFENRELNTHHLRRFVPTRASLTLEPAGDADDAPTVISTCPAVLRDAIVVDAAGATWKAASIPPGQRVRLEPAASRFGTWFIDAREYLPAIAFATAETPSDTPLTFRARADRWDETVPIPTLDSIRWTDEPIFVTGPVRSTAP